MPNEENLYVSETFGSFTGTHSAKCCVIKKENSPVSQQYFPLASSRQVEKAAGVTVSSQMNGQNYTKICLFASVRDKK